MDFAQRRLGPSADAQHERAAHVRLEGEVATVRHEIAQLKARLKLSFEEPGGFVAIGEELRRATERLRLLEAELKTRKLEAREEVWWSSSHPSAAGVAALPRSSVRFGERRPQR